VGKDAMMLGIRSWWETGMNLEDWWKLLKEAKTLYELVSMMMMMKMNFGQLNVFDKIMYK
jgi:hypothetical protein